MPLRIRILHVLHAHPFAPVQNRRIPPDCSAKIGPMPPLSTSDDVVHGGKRQATVIEVAVAHDRSRKRRPSTRYRLNRTAARRLHGSNVTCRLARRRWRTTMATTVYRTVWIVRLLWTGLALGIEERQPFSRPPDGLRNP